MKINSSTIRKLGATALGVLLLIYVGYQIYAINYKGLSTETANYAEVSDVIQSSGWAVRKETVVNSSYSEGVLNYNVSEGGKVRKGQAIAEVYSSEDDATAKNRIDRLDAEISSLEVLRATANSSFANPEQLGTQINDSIVAAMGSARNNSYGDMADEKDHLQILLNQKKIIVGKENAESYDARIAELKAERDSLESKSHESIGAVNADSAGYFISAADGYENAFDYDNIDNITVADINNVSQGNVSSGSIGKISSEFDWYIVCVINEAEKIKLESAGNVNIEIPFATAQKIPASIAAVNSDPETGNYALVLKCSYMNEDIAAIRNETLQIIVNTYSGVLVNQNSIYFNDVKDEVTDNNGQTQEIVHRNVKGVYIKYGSSISFVQVFSDVTINGYAICKLNLSDEESSMLYTDNTIQLYDEVVTGGKDLYDGKLL